MKTHKDPAIPSPWQHRKPWSGHVAMHRFGATYGVQNEGWNMMEPETIRNTVFLVKQERAFFGGQYTCVVLKTREAVTHTPMDSLKHAGACLQQEKYSSWGSKRRTGNKNRCFLIKRFWFSGFQESVRYRNCSVQAISHTHCGLILLVDWWVLMGVSPVN